MRNLLMCRNVLYNIYTYFFFWLCHARHAGSKFPDQGSNLCPLQWKRGAIITGLPGNFLEICYKELFFPLRYSDGQNISYITAFITEKFI